MKSFLTFIEEAKKKVVKSIYDPDWERLNLLKDDAAKLGDKLAGSLQLFVPRTIKFSGFKDLHPTGKVEESAPIFPGTRLISPQVKTNLLGLFGHLRQLKKEIIYTLRIGMTGFLMKCRIGGQIKDIFIELNQGN